MDITEAKYAVAEKFYNNNDRLNFSPVVLDIIGVVLKELVQLYCVNTKKANKPNLLDRLRLRFTVSRAVQNYGDVHDPNTVDQVVNAFKEFGKTLSKQDIDELHGRNSQV